MAREIWKAARVAAQRRKEETDLQETLWKEVMKKKRKMADAGNTSNKKKTRQLEVSLTIGITGADIEIEIYEKVEAFFREF
ncbi:hypothetical protein R1flu_022177 [Riccia fluitans]|uniref:Ribosomal protein L22 n=1 Tax=Riccia fluitans TaxID=41844 RepID=A0ABD1ZUJ7_9MARC